MTSDVTIMAALAAGMLSFLSPCVLPLVPPYLVYLAGTSLERLADAGLARSAKRDIAAAALLFVLGFSTVFVALGAGASVIGGFLRAYSHWLAIIAGLAIILMGLHFLGLTRIGFLMREKRAAMPKPVGLWGAYVGLLYRAVGFSLVNFRIAGLVVLAALVAALLSMAADRVVPTVRPVLRGIAVLGIFGAAYGALTLAFRHPDAIRAWQSLTGSPAN